MKPITILIPMLAMLCGCDPWARPIQREEFFDLKIKMQNELYDINMRIDALESPENMIHIDEQRLPKEEQ